MSASSLLTLDRRSALVLRRTISDLGLSAKAYSRVVIVARRIAEWARSDKIETVHVLEAIQFCTLQGDL